MVEEQEQRGAVVTRVFELRWAATKLAWYRLADDGDRLVAFSDAGGDDTTVSLGHLERLYGRQAAHGTAEARDLVDRALEARDAHVLWHLVQGSVQRGHDLGGDSDVSILLARLGILVLPFYEVQRCRAIAFEGGNGDAASARISCALVLDPYVDCRAAASLGRVTATWQREVNGRSGFARGPADDDEAARCALDASVVWASSGLGVDQTQVVVHELEAVLRREGWHVCLIGCAHDPPGGSRPAVFACPAMSYGVTPVLAGLG